VPEVAVTTKPRIRPSRSTEPKRRSSAAEQAVTAPSSPDGSRASIFHHAELADHDVEHVVVERQ